MNSEKWKRKFQSTLKWADSRNGIFIILIATGFICWNWQAAPPLEANNEVATSRADFDTYIPLGHTLIPVEVQNVEALDSVFGKYGLVSLYSSDSDNGKSGRLIAKRVKMLRAPNNPTQFGVMVKDGDTAPIAAHLGPFFVVVHSRKDTEGGSVQKLSPKKSFTIVED